MTWDNDGWSETFNEGQGLTNKLKTIFFTKFWKNNTKAILPKRISADQNLFFR
jgi:hypothetical protein